MHHKITKLHINLLLQCLCQRIIFNQFCKSPVRYQKVKSVCSNAFGDDDDDKGIEISCKPFLNNHILQIQTQLSYFQ